MEGNLFRRKCEFSDDYYHSASENNVDPRMNVYLLLFFGKNEKQNNIRHTHITLNPKKQVKIN